MVVVVAVVVAPDFSSLSRGNRSNTAFHGPNSSQFLLCAGQEVARVAESAKHRTRAILFFSLPQIFGAPNPRWTFMVVKFCSF